MKFEIDKIILWPKKVGKMRREIKFYSNKINVITGASRTGKSAIIPIIDYCLGSDKCTIPVDTIRDTCEWFGILIKLENEEILLCRKEPGQKSSTGDMYIQRKESITIPDKISKNTNLNAVKDIMNEIFSMTYLNIDDSEEKSNFLCRPSYRDCMAFLFQPQNIIANSNVLFYKADTAEHRKKLINIFPYVLGAITPEILEKKQIMERKEKELEKLKLDYQIIKDNIDSWKSEVGKWISIAYEYGFIEKNYSNNNFEEMVEMLEEISKKDVESSKIISNNIKDISDELVKLRDEEEKKSKELIEIENRYSEMKELLNTSREYEKSLEVQRERLEITEWLNKQINDEKKCPICGKNYDNTIENLKNLSNNISKIDTKKKKVGTIPIVFERELQQVDKERKTISDELEKLRKKIGQKYDYINENNDTKYTLFSMSRFLGKMENAVQTYKRIGKDSQLESKIEKLEAEINQLKIYVNQNEINKRVEKALEEIQKNAERLIPEFDTERPNDKIQFLIKDLTIKVRNQNGRDDYLWEIGSASNWLAYHISVLLAFQEFYQKSKGIKVPNFLVIDQPSQVYFPQKLSENDNEEYQNSNDEDKEAVKKIFYAMSQFLNLSKCNVQIIITEHAAKDMWEGLDNVELIELWRHGKKLIPLEWIEDSTSKVNEDKE